MKKEIVGIMFDCAQVSTSHALPKIVTNKSWFIKALWIFSLIVSSAYCIYNLNKSFLYFFNYESITLIKTHRLQSIQFPTVTFCSKNPFNPQKLKNFQNISKKINQIKSMLNQNEETQSILQFMASVEHESFQNVIEFKELMNYVGYELNDILIDCRFGDMDCDRDNFVNITIPKFGNCFQFNSGRLLNGSKTDLKQSKAPGISVGLKLVLFGGFKNSEIDLFNTIGVQIFVHNSSTLPYADFDYLNVALGYETDIVVSQKMTRRLPEPYSRCLKNTSSNDSFDSRTYKRTVALLETYNQKMCIMVCYNGFIFDNCGCYYPDFWNENTMQKSEMCTNEHLDCINDADIAYRKSESLLNCFDSCPEECEIVEYGYKISMTDFANSFFFQALDNLSNISFGKNVSSFNQFKENFLAVNIYHDDIAMTFVEEKPNRTVEQLVAEIGGFLGLCAGLSLLSIAEIFEFFLKIVLLLLSKQKINTDFSISKR